ncbi:MAG TPA: tetratricopeptide repeat protein [Phycisphaerales bacterium]|nr:tetratricopeptide repeat protein [Phycisphaerales bacterium]
MATEKQQTIIKDNTSEVPSDSELFAGEPPIESELSEREVFAGNEDFYKRLAGSAQPAPVQIGRKLFSTVQKILVVGIVVIVAVLVYALLKSPSTSVGGETPLVQQRPAPEPLVGEATQAVSQQITKLSLANPAGALSRVEPVTRQEMPIQPLSLKAAQDFYLEGDYEKAYAAYKQLRQNLPAGTEEETLRDFLQLKMALCMQKAGDYGQAGRLFRKASKSRSPVVKVVANYHRSLLEVQKGQYLSARTRAYQTIGLIGAMDFNLDWALSLKRACSFLIAECLSRNVLSLRDADKELPDDLWSNPGASIDPFAGLSEAQLRAVLNSGSEQLSKGLLGPQIRRIGRVNNSTRWSVTCHGASIEELLARFAANADLDIRWAFGDGFGPDGAGNSVRKRPVSLYLPAATTQQFITVAAGSAGLLARLDEQRNVSIFNPADYSFLSEHVSLLSQEAISLWQRFLLAFPGDERIPNAHFALGLLQAQRGVVTESIAEYKLVANSSFRTSLAPFALLQSSKLKTSLRDYVGAREDLSLLVEQYPDTEIADHAYLYLADATMKAGLLREAGRVYRKIYNLDLSPESQTAAALGAARCFYEEKDYEAAAKWLTRYINFAKDGAGEDLYSAYFLMGKTLAALGRPEAANDTFLNALAGSRLFAKGAQNGYPVQLSKEEYVETVSALVGGYMQQGRLVEALDVLENVRSGVLSQKESVEMLLLKSEIFRAMGLVDKAIAALSDRSQYLSDPQLKARISFELTNCYIAEGKLELARSNLTEILVIVEPGPLADQVALKLADVCLKLGQNSQTVSICSQLLDSGPSAAITQKALGLLATAYNRQKNYDRAVSALLGKWK